MKKDIFQERYLKHQKKKKQLLDLLNERVSQRSFIQKEIDPDKLELLLGCMTKVPSSCARQAIYGDIIGSKNSKELLGGLLVGGVGWVYRADKIILLFASREAYKGENEIDYMPYLDAGAVVATAYLICEDIELGCCYINPNIRTENLHIFRDMFGIRDDIFCGALAVGYYTDKSKPSVKKASIVKN